MDGEVTRLLARWKAGDPGASDALFPLIYDELVRLSKRVFAGERAGHTLQPTALVHEAYMNLLGAELDWKDRGHFFAVAARMMRRLLINHAEARRAEKRGGGRPHVPIEEVEVSAPLGDDRFLDLARALARLEETDPRKARVADLFYFAGLTAQEISDALDLSTATVTRDLRVARAFLAACLDEPGAAGP